MAHKPSWPLVARQVELLRKQCGWQRSQGTSRDNGYPYHKHQPDCDICRSADLLERQARDIRAQEVFATSQRKLVAVQAERIKELEAAKHKGPCPDCPYLDEIPPAPAKVIEDLQQKIEELEDD